MKASENLDKQRISSSNRRANIVSGHPRKVNSSRGGHAGGGCERSCAKNVTDANGDGSGVAWGRGVALLHRHGVLCVPRENKLATPRVSIRWSDHARNKHTPREAEIAVV